MGESVSANSDSWLSKFLHRSKSPGPNNKAVKNADPDEQTSLLPNPLTNGWDEAEDQENADLYDLEDGGKQPTELILNESLLILKGSIPVILAYALQNSLQTVSVVIVGRGSPKDLATAAFSYMFAMSTAWLIALGGSTAME